MKQGWQERLWEMVAADQRSERAISLAAHLGPNYLGQTRSRGSSPVSEKLAALLDALGETAALYVMTGVVLNAEGVKALNALADVPVSLRGRAMDLFLAMGAGEEPPTSPAPPPADGAEAHSKSESH